MTDSNKARLGAFCSLLILFSASFALAAADYSGTLNSAQQGLIGGDDLPGTVQYPDGVACTAASQCSGGYCVHGVCRSSSTYCGDTFCDSGESCSGDCGGGATPTPTPTPAPTAPPTTGGGGGPVSVSTATPAATATPAPTAAPTLAPGEVSAAETTTEFQQLLPTESGASAPVMVTRSLEVSEEPSVAEGFVSTFTVTVENQGGQALEQVEIKEKIPADVIPEYLGPNPDDYPNIEWNPRPARIERGSVVAVWLVQKLAANEQLKFVYSIAKKISKSVTQTPEYKSAPVIATRAGAATAAPPLKITAIPKPSPAPGAFKLPFDPLVGAVVVVLALAAYFLFFKKKRHKGL